MSFARIFWIASAPSGSLGDLRDRPAGLLRLTVPRMGYEQIIAPRLALLDSGASTTPEKIRS